MDRFPPAVSVLRLYHPNAGFDSQFSVPVRMQFSPGCTIFHFSLWPMTCSPCDVQYGILAFRYLLSMELSLRSGAFAGVKSDWENSCTCTHTCTHAHMHVHMHAHMHVRKHACTRILACTHTHLDEVSEIPPTVLIGVEEVREVILHNPIALEYVAG